MTEGTEELRTEVERLRADRDRRSMVIARQRRELQVVIDQRARAEQEARRLRQELEKVHRSTTWRVGDALLRLPKKLKEGLRARRRGVDVGGPSGRHVAPSPLRLDVPLVEDVEQRRAYEQVIDGSLGDGTGLEVAFLVSTVDLDAGRGDLFVAAALGKFLARRGHRPRFLPPDRWLEVGPDVDVVVAMICEPSVVLDPFVLPSTVRRVAWIRNNTERWLTTGQIAGYDLVLASSSRSARDVGRVCDVPVEVLPIGVDTELFTPSGSSGGRRGVVTTVNQWSTTPRTTHRLLSEVRPQVPLALYGVQKGIDRELAAFAHGPVSYFALPSLYRSVDLVLDDQQDVNAPYGNLNSRVYESLACGALPATNARFGLVETGLEGVPVIETADDLRDLLRRLQDDRDDLTASADELRGVVVSRHGYDDRAQRFEEALERHGLTAGVPSRRRLVGFFPDYRVTNPYQDMLYRSLRSNGVPVRPVAGPEDLATLPGVGDDAPVLHVHWTATVLGPAGDDAREGRRLLRRFLDGVDLLLAQGGALVWTVHNLMPHESALPDLERELRQGLADRAAAIHVLCERTVGLLGEILTVDPGKVLVVPHGSYLDVYPDVVDEDVARAELGVGQDETVLLVLGQVRPYKGIERLLDAFVEARRRRPDLRLVVAGGVGRFEGAKELADRIQATDGVVAHLEVVEDERLQVYFRGSDVVVLPHRRVLNSGGALLALSYGRPVIAPDTGCIPSVVTPDVGRLFTDDADLVEALASAEELRDVDRRRAAYAKAVAFTPDDMSDAFRAGIENILTSGTSDGD